MVTENRPGLHHMSGNYLPEDPFPGKSEAAQAIHPAPKEFADDQIAEDPILRFFHYAHLPDVLKARSQPFANLARIIVTNTPRNAERTVALRKLLEAKDAAVRAAL